MSASNEQFYGDLKIGQNNVTTMNSSLDDDDPLADFLEPFKINGDLPIQTAFDFSSDWNFDLYDQDSSSAIDIFLSKVQSTSERLEIIEQPHQSSKLRYRSDYIREKTRLGVLNNKNKESYHRGPVVCIPQCYRNSNNEHYICICLVTVKNTKTNLHYFHPYELEHPCDEQLNDRQSNTVWFPIEQINSDGFMSFPLLRMVKTKALHLRKLDRLRVFDCHNQGLQNQSFLKFSSGVEMDIVKEYNLERSHLAFTIGNKQTVNGQSSMVLYANTTVLSEEMCEDVSKPLNPESEGEPTNERPNSSSFNQLIYKYAPRSGGADVNAEVLVFLRKKLHLRKHEDLQVTMECDTSNGHWSQPVLDLEIKSRMISFKTPTFSYPMTKTMPVNIVLRQNNRIFAVLKYSYLPIFDYK